jgi:hypothetical protein
MFNVSLRRAVARHTRRYITPLSAACLISCHDVPTLPSANQRLASSGAVRDVRDSPAGVGASLSATDEAPLQGGGMFVGNFPTATVVEMTANQTFTIRSTDPASPRDGILRLGGRWSQLEGCSHQGEAYLGANGAIVWAGCSVGDVSSFTGYIQVVGDVNWGYSFDSACPYPDYGCAAYSGNSSVSLSAVSAQLALALDDSSVTPDAVPAGHELTFRGTVTPATIGSYSTPVSRVDGWTYTTASGVDSLGDCFVASANAQCVRRFTESGTLSLDAMVNGRRQTVGPIAITIVQPTFKLTSSASTVTEGDTVLVSLSLTPVGERIDWYRFSSTPIRDYGGGGGEGILRTPSSPALANAQAASNPPTSQPRLSPATTASLSTTVPSGLEDCNLIITLVDRCYVVMADTGVNWLKGQAYYNRLPVSDSAQVYVRPLAPRLVKVSLKRNTMRPTVRYWKFNPKTKEYRLRTDPAPDTNRVVVTVSVTRNGVAEPNADVTFTLGPHEGSAGHLHEGGRPVGIFQLLDKSPLPGQMVNTGPSGVTKVYYVASEISGPVTIGAYSPAAAPDSTVIEVRIPDFVALAPGPHYVFT